MRSLSDIWKRFNNWLEVYVKDSGDGSDIILQKKIWWLLSLGSAPVLTGSVIFMRTTLGKPVFYSNIFFLLCLLLPLIIFHFHRRNIERFALFTQLSIVLLTAVKVYLMGGMIHVGTPVYVGLIGAVYALILPDKKRAVNIFLLYTVSMITVTLMNPLGSEQYIFYKYFMGFLISNTTIFFTIYYFTSQWEKTKQVEKNRLKELDELKTKFYTHIAHEFRTPLSIISGTADQMKDNPSKWLGQGYEMIKRNCKQLISLTNQLLDLSKLEGQAMSLNLIHDDMALYSCYLIESFHSMAASRNISLTFFSEPDEIFMDLDPDKVRDILSNLISNALKYTPEGGTVSVHLYRIEQDDKPFVRIEVRDSGIGIPHDEQPLVFNRYFQAKNHFETHSPGSGLGLALTKELVKLMGGDITLQSTPGKGSVFEVRLPINEHAEPVALPQIKNLYDAQSSLQMAEESIMSDVRSFNARIRLLLIEDNADVLVYLTSILEDKYTIETAMNGAEGFQKALETIPDLIISDVMMPEMDGFTLSKKLKSNLQTSHIPIILLTARSDFDSRIEGLNTGADAYLSKPFNKRELFVRINKLIHLRKSLQQRYTALSEQMTFGAGDSNGEYSREDAFMNKVQMILTSHLSDEEFGIIQLCESLAMSRSQLYRKFSALTDMTVNQYIISLRLEKARELLTTTGLNVSEVAYDTGFKNPAYFSRVFSDKFGYAPSQVKER